MSAPKVGETTQDSTLLGRRGAFHVPGILVKSAQDQIGGNAVRFIDADLTHVRVSLYGDAQAIVDPFVEWIPRGTLFWVFPVPGLVNDLVHSFKVAIPGVPEPVAASVAREPLVAAIENWSWLDEPREPQTVAEELGRLIGTVTVTPKDAPLKEVIDPREPFLATEDNDDNCKGCYGDGDEEDSACKGCYT